MPRLINSDDASSYLAFQRGQFEWMVKTGQFTPIKLRGEERFDRRDLDLLIESYKRTAMRRIGKCQPVSE